MAFRKVLTWPNPKLKLCASPVTDFDDSLRQLAIDLIDTCKVKFGAGLAATQIGDPRSVVVLKPSEFDFKNKFPSEYDEEFWVLINPELFLGSDYCEWEEACLSIPDYRGSVRRSSMVDVTFQDLNGTSKKLTCEWPLSGAVQHECDHLEGKLYLDRMPKRPAAKIKQKIWQEKKKIAKALKRRS